MRIIAFVRGLDGDWNAFDAKTNKISELKPDIGWFPAPVLYRSWAADFDKDIYKHSSEDDFKVWGLIVNEKTNKLNVPYGIIPVKLLHKIQKENWDTMVLDTETLTSDRPEYIEFN